MNDCPHLQVTPTAQCFLITDPSAEDTTAARTIHLSVKCALCGWPFKFVGSFAEPPLSPAAIISAPEPWASWAQGEVALRMIPMVDGDMLNITTAAGHA